MWDRLHPRLISEGFDIGRKEAMTYLESFMVPIDGVLADGEKVVCAARPSLRTKVAPAFADSMAEEVVDDVQCVKVPEKPMDSHMMEILHMRHTFAALF